MRTRTGWYAASFTATPGEAGEVGASPADGSWQGTGIAFPRIQGAIAGPRVDLDLRTLYLTDLTLLGCTTQVDGVFERLVGYLEAGELVPPLAATYPLSDISTAQRDFAAKRHVGKLVLVVPPAD